MRSLGWCRSSRLQASLRGWLLEHHSHTTSLCGCCIVCRFCCIAPVIAARLLPGVELTVGMSKDGNDRWPYAGTAASIAAMGATHVDKDVMVSLEILPNMQIQPIVQSVTTFVSQL